MLLSNLYVFVLGCIVSLICYKLATDRLKKFPGPRTAPWSNLWRVVDVYFGVHRLPSSLKLHRRYGDVVRVGPNTLSFSNPQAIKDIYGTDHRYPKAEMYTVHGATAQGKVNYSLFSSIDMQWHDNLRRAVSPAFNLSVMIQYEPYVDSNIRELLSQLDNRFAGKNGSDGIVSMDRWMHWYAFDVIGTIAYSEPFGALRNGSDINNILSRAHWSLTYGSWAGCMPFLDKLTFKNPLRLWLNRRGWFNSTGNPAVPWALKQQAAFRKKSSSSDDTEGPQVLFSKFLKAQETHPEYVGDKELLGLGLSMILAGSESTGVTLTAIVYFLLKNQEVYQKLQAEIDEAFPSSQDVCPFHTAFSLPYLDACVKEAFRMHPAARFAMERLLPPEGAQIDGRYIPGGTIVGMNAWALHRRSDVFGDKVDRYIPERWLPSPDKPHEQERARIDTMSRTLLHFGAGKFNCIGKNISYLEMYKVVPALLHTFHLELDKPHKEWRFEEGSFVNVSGVEIRVKKW